MVPGRAKVLVIEDNEADADLVKELLREGGAGLFTVETAELLATGRTILAQGGIDVILLDLGLPDSQGLATLAELYWISPETPIVVLTGYDDEESAIKAVKLGAQDYLLKGEVDEKLLVRSLRYAIERNRLKQELESLRASFTSIVDNSPDGLIVMERRTGAVLYANPKASRILGMSQEDLVGPVLSLPLSENLGDNVVLDLPGGGSRPMRIRVSNSEWKGIPAVLAILSDNVES
jgi:CheY-like chemotaxis protein